MMTTITASRRKRQLTPAAPTPATRRRSTTRVSMSSTTTMSLLSLLLLLISLSLTSAHFIKGGVPLPPQQQEDGEDADPSTSKSTIVTETPQTRVIGGNTVTDPFKFPYFAQLADASCAGVLVAPDYLLTAAHCERRNHPFYKRVYFASTELRSGIFRTIEYTRAHPAYLPTLQDYDFALLKLTTSALEDDEGEPTGVEVLELNRDPNVPQPGDKLQAMGFGKIEETGTGMNPTLQEVVIDYLDNDTCKQQYGADQFYAHVMFCSGVPGGGKDTCQGDSGGPIVDIATNTLAGIVSYGVGCARANFAGVNARVSTVVDWIDAEICRGSNYKPASCTRSTTFELEGGEGGNGGDDGQASVQISLTPEVTLGALTVYGELDDYPEEFAWSLTYLGVNPTTESASKELYAQLPNTISKQGAELDRSFVDLQPGQYDLVFGDNGSDGICCGFGVGELWVVNDLTDETVWSHDGQYQSFLSVRLKLDDYGEITVVSESESFQTSWQVLEQPNYPPEFDAEWPGPMPTSPTFAFNVNFKFDAFPYESSYRVYHLTDYQEENWETVVDVYMDVQDEWTLVDSLSGMRNGEHNALVPKQVDQLQDYGWYWLHVTDTSGDGVCCQFRRGWVSLTGPIITTMDQGLVWGNDGEYGKGVDVYFYINADGYIAQVHWIVQSELEDAEDAEDADSTAASKTENKLSQWNKSWKFHAQQFHSRYL